MIEIVCPSCEAHYQLPDGSIGPEGRKVSCSNCSHKWRAYPVGHEPAEVEAHGEAGPETARGSAPDAIRESIRDSIVEPAPDPEPAAEPAAEPTPGPAPELAPEPEAARESLSASMTAAGAATAGTVDPPPASGDRDEQMAAIRQMLADLKESADTAPEPASEEQEEPTGPAPVMRKRSSEEYEDDDVVDPLKSRIDALTQTKRAAKGEPARSDYDTVKLRRLHEKRAKRFQRARERRKKSGGFLTGFTLVAVVTATMVGLYVMKPNIIAAQPKLEPAMNEYVAAIDGYRLELNTATAEYKDWLIERIDKLRGKVEEGE